jgi:hypothetical protein
MENLTKRIVLLIAGWLLASTALAQTNIAWWSNTGEMNNLYASDGKTSKLVAADAGGGLTVSDKKIVYAKKGALYEFDGSRNKLIAQSGSLASQKSLDGNNLVYSAFEGDNAMVKLYDGASTKTIWSSGTSLVYPVDVKISGKYMVWGTQAHADNGFGHDLYIYDGVKTQNLNTLTGTSRDFQLSYDISGNTVVWGHDNYQGTISYIDVWDGKTHQEIKSTDFLYTQPKVSGKNVAFIGRKGTQYEIFMWDGKTTRQLTNSAVTKTALQLSGNIATWYGLEGDKAYTYVWDGSKEIKLSTPLTAPDYNPSFSPQVSNGSVVWQGLDSSAQSQIYIWDQ